MSISHIGTTSGHPSNTTIPTILAIYRHNSTDYNNVSIYFNTLIDLSTYLAKTSSEHKKYLDNEYFPSFATFFLTSKTKINNHVIKFALNYSTLSYYQDEDVSLEDVKTFNETGYVYKSIVNHKVTYIDTIYSSILVFDLSSYTNYFASKKFIQSQLNTYVYFSTRGVVHSYVFNQPNRKMNIANAIQEGLMISSTHSTT